MKPILLLIACLITSHLLYAQFGLLSWSVPDMFPTGGECGYQKNGIDQIYTKHQMRFSCNSAYYGTDNQLFWNYPGGSLSDQVVLLSNSDSNSKVQFFYSIGSPYQHPSGGTVYTQTLHLADRTCITCNASGISTPLYQQLQSLNETVLDTPIRCAAHLPYFVSVDSDFNSLTLFVMPVDLFQDSLSYHLKNVPPAPPSRAPTTTTAINPTSTSICFSRIFRYHAYTSINSPEATNRAVMTAQRGKPATYHFGYVDKENDSINVTPVQWQVTHARFHPNYVPADSNNNLFYKRATQNFIKHAIRDSIVNLAYYPGYSPTNPFGPGSSYSLDPATGDISFTAPDTGLYFLAYRVTEYRDGQPLGDMMTYRLAFVTDSGNYVLPVVKHPSSVSGTTYDSTQQLMVVCPGQPVSFTVNASSALPDAAIKLANNFQQSCPGSAVGYTGIGTNSASTTFSWTPTTADGGWHYLYVDAVDTACGPTHKLLHVNRGFRILVRSKIKAAATDTVACANQPNKLYLTSGAGQGPVQWTVLAGGDPLLSCTTCDTAKISPDSITRYVATVTAGGCTFRDTITVHIKPKPTAAPIIATPVAGQNGLYNFSSGGTGGTSFAWNFGNGSGGTGSSVTYTYQTNGTYNVRLIVSNSCGSDTAYKTIVIKGLGIGNIPANDKTVSVYPNPANEQITIKSEIAITSVRIIDATGKLIKELKGNHATELKLPVKGLAAGIYTITIQTDKGVVVKTVAVER